MTNTLFNKINCYAILEIPKSSSIDEIRRAYREQSKIWHPDVKGGSNEKMILVNYAYETLSDPIKRTAHDRILNSQKQKSHTRGFQKSYTHTKSDSKSTARNQEKYSWPKKDSFDVIYERIRLEIREKAETLKSQRKVQIEELSSRLIERFKNTKNARQKAYYIALLLLALIWQSWISVSILFLSWMIAFAFGGFYDFEGYKISYKDNNWKAKIVNFAKQKIDSKIRAEINQLEQKENFLRRVEELVQRNSTFDQSEEQVVRRIACAFFIMGYIPINFDRQYRFMKFFDGESYILV